MSADLHLDTGVLAVGALPPEELPDVEAHLETCASCALELAGFLETVALLGGAAAETPPASLRRSVMQAIAVTPQLPPLPARPDAPGTPLIPGPGAHRAADVETGDIQPAGETGEEPADHTDADHDGTDQPADRGPGSVTPIRRRWYRRPGTYLIAAAAAAILATGTVVAVNQFTGPDAQTALQECIEQAPDRDQLSPAAGSGGVTIAPSCAGVLVDVSGLPQLQDDRTYQLWMLTDATNPRSLSLLPAVADGGQQVVVAPTQPGDTAIGVTNEPAAGSEQPTSTPVWAVPLES